MKKEQKSKLAWLWENMKGYRALYVLSLLGTILYNVMQLAVPYVSQKIIDLFLSGEQAAENLATKRDLFWELVVAMVALTLVRTTIVYLSCMGGHPASMDGEEDSDAAFTDEEEDSDPAFTDGEEDSDPAFTEEGGDGEPAFAEDEAEDGIGAAGEAEAGDIGDKAFLEEEDEEYR